MHKPLIYFVHLLLEEYSLKHHIQIKNKRVIENLIITFVGYIVVQKIKDLISHPPSVVISVE